MVNEPERYTITVYPSSLDDDNSVYDSYENLNNAFDSGSANNYANFHWVKGANAETKVYLNFDLSAIPEGAIIVDVSGKGRINTTGYQSDRWLVRGIYLCSGTTQKSNSMYPTSLTSFSDSGEWTLEELRDAKICYYITRRTAYATTDYYLYVYGGSLTVTYDVYE